MKLEAEGDDRIVEEEKSGEQTDEDEDDEEEKENGFDTFSFEEGKRHELAEDEAEQNPFVLPSDDQIFLIREKERKLKQEQRENLKRMTVWEKTQMGTRRSANRRNMLKKIPANDSLHSNQDKRTRGLVNAASAAISNGRRREKENTSDFIAKKREMFLVQMSLDTKREEIRKLEEKAQLKEEALKKSELMLEEDAIRFDTFLKENDKKAHEAIKKAEAETKAKQDKVQEIKRLNHQIQAVQSEMSKLKEQLEDCLKYKRFLDDLTPPEWFEHQTQERRERRQAAREQEYQKKLEEYEHEKRRVIEEFEKAKREYEEGGSRGKPPSLALPEAPKFQDFNPRQRDIESKTFEKEDGAKLIENGEFKNDADDDEEGNNEFPMYFTKPSQMLDIFTQLEESNLFLIQNSQETEQALEELKQEFRLTKERMDQKTQSLKSNIDELQQHIASEEEKTKQLEDRMHTSSGEDAQENLLHQLNEKVKEVYKRCGFDCDTSPATLTMLTDLEAKLEDLLAQIEQMPQEYVTKAEKMKEKERRERVRAERMAQQQAIYEERLRKSIERSMQAPKKKTGKPVMFRSAPPQKKVKKKDDSAAEAERLQDEKEFFSW